ncbi:uncharacterized protein LOC107368963 [Tetranychus urticae]|uniref:uncharacterized protein LOC107368963 n=1 Tax=Tetranychus urticae TaxID=32264 RepID=UPI000D64E46F|nr:uncharacterized protein LOC107368963 [Tetranychus urticae]
MDSDLTKYCFFDLQRFLVDRKGVKNNIKTEPTDEDPKVSPFEFICAIKTLPDFEAQVLGKTPDWVCKKYKIDQGDTFTRIVDHVPATADRRDLYVCSTIGRAIIGSETAKMLQSMGIPEVTKEEFPEEETQVRSFLSGGFNPSTQSIIENEKIMKREMRKKEREMERKTMKRRIMTRKTAEREKRKRRIA